MGFSAESAASTNSDFGIQLRNSFRNDLANG